MSKMWHGLDQQVGLVLPVCIVRIEGGGEKKRERERKGGNEKEVERRREEEMEVYRQDVPGKTKVENFHEMRAKTRS